MVEGLILFVPVSEDSDVYSADFVATWFPPGRLDRWDGAFPSIRTAVPGLSVSQVRADGENFACLVRQPFVGDEHIPALAATYEIRGTEEMWKQLIETTRGFGPASNEIVLYEGAVAWVFAYRKGLVLTDPVDFVNVRSWAAAAKRPTAEAWDAYVESVRHVHA